MVTFLFTDLEGSTRLWEEHPDAMRDALARHDKVLRAVIDGHSGFVFSTGGDGVAAAFQRSGDAVAAAIASQVALLTEPWPEPVELRVRMGLHTGEANERDAPWRTRSASIRRRSWLMWHGFAPRKPISRRTSSDVSPGSLVRPSGRRRRRTRAGAGACRHHCRSCGSSRSRSSSGHPD